MQSGTKHFICLRMLDKKYPLPGFAAVVVVGNQSLCADSLNCFLLPSPGCMSRECLSAAQCLSKALKKNYFLNITIFPSHLTELFTYTIETPLWLETVNAKVKKNKKSAKCRRSNLLSACLGSYSTLSLIGGFYS